MPRYEIIKSDEPVRGIVITRNQGEYVAEYYCDNEFGEYLKETEVGLGEHIEITFTKLAKMAREALNKPKSRVFGKVNIKLMKKYKVKLMKNFNIDFPITDNCNQLLDFFLFSCFNFF